MIFIIGPYFSFQLVLDDKKQNVASMTCTELYQAGHLSGMPDLVDPNAIK